LVCAGGNVGAPQRGQHDGQKNDYEGGQNPEEAGQHAHISLKTTGALIECIPAAIPFRRACPSRINTNHGLATAKCLGLAEFETGPEPIRDCVQISAPLRNETAHQCGSLLTKTGLRSQ
jgi:hypothetical protein